MIGTSPPPPFRSDLHTYVYDFWIIYLPLVIFSNCTEIGLHLGKEKEKDVFCLVTSMGQRENLSLFFT